MISTFAILRYKDILIFYMFTAFVSISWIGLIQIYYAITMQYGFGCILMSKKIIATHFKAIYYHLKVNFRQIKFGNYLSLRDVTPLFLRANVVYCSMECFNKTHIIRYLLLSVQEHLSEKIRKSASYEHTSSYKDRNSCSINKYYTLGQVNTDIVAKKEYCKLKIYNYLDWPNMLLWFYYFVKRLYEICNDYTKWIPIR